jgi:hypothetical protein
VTPLELCALCVFLIFSLREKKTAIASQNILICRSKGEFPRKERKVKSICINLWIIKTPFNLHQAIFVNNTKY